MDKIISKVFNNEEFGKLTVVKTDGELWFVGKEVATILGYSNTRQALKRHVDEEDKVVAKLDTLGGKQKMNIINESGLYSLILKSKLPSAKNFKHWVTAEVLPAIRKTGAYIEEPKQIVDTYFSKLDEADKLIIKNMFIQIKKQQEEILKLKPKAEFAEEVNNADNTISIGDFAKLIKGWGRNKMFKWLRKEGLLMRNNQPYQQYINNGYFKVIEKTWKNKKYGTVNVATQTRLTGKGQLYLQKKLKEEFNKDVMHIAG